MSLRLSLIAITITLSLVGCARLSVSNHSLDYKKIQTTAPLQIPDGIHMRPQQALYPMPEISPQALEQAPNYTNSKGNRYALPRPMMPAATVLANNAAGKGDLRPQLVKDGNGIPLLKVDADSASVWQYTQSAISAANLKSYSGKNDYILHVEYQNQSYILRLSQTSLSSVIGVYDGKTGKFADQASASELLSLLIQNWPSS